MEIDCGLSSCGDDLQAFGRVGGGLDVLELWSFISDEGELSVSSINDLKSGGFDLGLRELHCGGACIRTLEVWEHR